MARATKGDAVPQLAVEPVPVDVMDIELALAAAEKAAPTFSLDHQIANLGEKPIRRPGLRNPVDVSPIHLPPVEGAKAPAIAEGAMRARTGGPFRRTSINQGATISAGRFGGKPFGRSRTTAATASSPCLGPPALAADVARLLPPPIRKTLAAAIPARCLVGLKNSPALLARLDHPPPPHKLERSRPAVERISDDPAWHANRDQTPSQA